MATAVAPKNVTGPRSDRRNPLEAPRHKKKRKRHIMAMSVHMGLSWYGKTDID